MIIKQNSLDISSIITVDLLRNGNDSETTVELNFKNDGNKKIKFTFHGSWERQEFLQQMKKLVNLLQEKIFHIRKIMIQN